MIGVETVGLAMAALPPDVATRILTERPDVVFCGAINPLGRAVPVEGGYLVETSKDRFPGAKTGRSCLNLTKPDEAPEDAVRDLVRETWVQYRHGQPDRPAR